MSRNISFTVVVALLLGWAVMGLLVVKSNDNLIRADLLDSERPVPLPRGVKLKLDIDKKVYGPGDPILISLRNDSSKDVWLSEHADGCDDQWWTIETLKNGETWTKMTLDKSTCSTVDFGGKKFPKHTVQTAEWSGLIAATGQIGDIFNRAPTGTYRVQVPYVVGQEPKTADWTAAGKFVNSLSFTIQ